MIPHPFRTGSSLARDQGPLVGARVAQGAPFPKCGRDWNYEGDLLVWLIWKVVDPTAEVWRDDLAVSPKF